MKVLFDRSAFHGNSFDLLANSPLPQLVQAREVLVFHTSVFLDETLRMAQSRKPVVRAELVRQGEFLLSICNGGWFRPLFDVCRDELNRIGAIKDYALVPSQARNSVEARFRAFFQGAGPLEELNTAAPIWHENEQKKKLQKTLLSDLRMHGRGCDVETFLEYYESVASDCALHLLGGPLGVEQPKVKAHAWGQDPDRFPHVAALIELLAYALYDAEQNQNSPLDKNWQSDAEQLCFLVDVDMIVSADQGFMKRAVAELWEPRGRRLCEPNEFVHLLSTSLHSGTEVA